MLEQGRSSENSNWTELRETCYLKLLVHADYFQVFGVLLPVSRFIHCYFGKTFQKTHHSIPRSLAYGRTYYYLNILPGMVHKVDVYLLLTKLSKGTVQDEWEGARAIAQCVALHAAEQVLSPSIPYGTLSLQE